MSKLILLIAVMVSFSAHGRETQHGVCVQKFFADNLTLMSVDDLITGAVSACEGVTFAPVVREPKPERKAETPSINKHREECSDDGAEGCGQTNENQYREIKES